MGRTRGWRRFGTFGLLVLVTVLAAELALQVLHHVRPSMAVHDSSSYQRFRGRPQAQDYDLHLNSHGFKDVKFGVAKAPGTPAM